MSKKIRYSNEPVTAKVIDDCLPPPDELAAAIERARVKEVHRRSADAAAGQEKTIAAEEVSKRARARIVRRRKGS